MKIGNLEINGFCALAPMAGVADNAMRKICKEFGAAYCVSELVSAKGIVLKDRKSRSLFEFEDCERPMGLQIFGDDAEIMKEAALVALEYHPDFIDINMGCPAPKVAKSGGGSALLKTPEKAGKILYAVKNAVNVPVTAKIRIGIDNEHINAVEVAKTLEYYGADAITVHGRTRAQMYAPPVHINEIANVKNAVKIPVIGNGDITDGKSAAKMKEDTGCDFLMVGRAAMGHPWVFSQINAYLSEARIMPEPPFSYRMSVLLRQVTEMVKNEGEKIAMLKARKHAAWYFTGMKNAAKYRRKAGELKTFSDLEKLVCEIMEEKND